MKTGEAVEGLGSLAQETRLSIYRLLVKRGPKGLAAGAIAEVLGVPGSSLSFHLHHLMRAGLITQERKSRQLIYAAHFGRMNALVAFLTENCCGGSSCVPVCDVPARSEVASRRQSGRARGRSG
jgi:ArsR family transcriptional regulator, arsenate/arsenite/antimonite-responsive transcriptional repressor